LKGKFVAKRVALTALCAALKDAPHGLQLRPGSPLIDVGTDLRPYGLNVGTRDFFGNPIPSGGGFDIGAHEYQEGLPNGKMGQSTPTFQRRSQL
jgi:hypothetical protein